MTNSTAVIYVRASQDREGKATSVSDQERACRTLADRRGLTVTHVYSDNDRGASTLSRRTRPEFARMLDDARAGKVQVILAYSSSRLTRRPKEFEVLIELAEKTGVRIMTDRSGDPDFTTAQGRGMARTLAAWDAVQAEQTGENIRSSITGRIAEGKDLGGSRPFGFESSRTEIRESEAKFVREAHRGILDEGAAVYAVAKWLTEAGAKTTGAATQWTPRATRAMLLRPRNAGILVHKGAEIPGSTLPAIVSREDHEAMVALLNDPSRAPKRGPRAVHLLSGIAKCGVCGYTLAHTMSSKGGGRSYAIYRCTNNAPVGRGTHPTMRDTTLEGEVEGLLLDRIAESEDTPAGPDVSRIRDIGTRLAEIASERTQATQLGLMPGADLKAVAGKLTALADEENTLTGERDALVSANVSGAAFDAFREYVKANAGAKTWGYLVARDSAYEVWEKYDMDRKRDILRGFDVKLWPKGATERITVQKR